MEVEVVFLDSFVHGHINARMNKTSKLDYGTAKELENAGLLRIKTTKSVGETVGKELDDGQGQPSSASQVAPPSQKPTVERYAAGGKRIE